jgi:hypothetical protein
MSWISKLRQAQAELAQLHADPYRHKVEAAVRGKEAISSAALLDLLDVPKTTGNARRVGKTMRSMGFIPIKSRRLMPGGFRDTVARGWARPVRKNTSDPSDEAIRRSRFQPKGDHMKYLLEQRGDDYFAILNGDADCCVGYVTARGPRYHVQTDEDDEIAFVKSIGEAIPALVAYYEAHPPQWQRESDTRLIKNMQFGLLQVEQDKPGQWLAYRNDHDHPLVREGKPAIFATSEEAQRAADTHARDGYPNSETIYDGFVFFPDRDPWWSYPNRLAVRTQWAKNNPH